MFAREGRIVLAFRTEPDVIHEFEIDQYELFRLLAAAASGLSDDPLHQTTQSAQHPVLTSSDPSFEVGYRNGGGCVLAIDTKVVPPLQFDLSPDALSELIALLTAAAQAPRTSGMPQ